MANSGVLITNAQKKTKVNHRPSPAPPQTQTINSTGALKHDMRAFLSMVPCLGGLTPRATDRVLCSEWDYLSQLLGMAFWHGFPQFSHSSVPTELGAPAGQKGHLYPAAWHPWMPCLARPRTSRSGNVFWVLSAPESSVFASGLGRGSCLGGTFFPCQPQTDHLFLRVTEGVSTLPNAISTPLRVTPGGQKHAPQST